MNQQHDQTTSTKERLIHGYEQMLQRAQHSLAAAVTHSETALKQALDAAREKAIDLGELSREEADKVYHSVARDLHDAGSYLASQGRELADWLRLDLLVAEQGLLNRLSALAQAAKLELQHLERATHRLGEWHTGEVTTIGTLRCKACGEQVHFARTGHIPPCPKCHATVFERAKV